MKNLTLENLAAACNGRYVGPEEKRNVCVTAITTDSRKVTEGCLFVAIRGARVDGHRFISQVMKAGGCGSIIRTGTGGSGLSIHSGGILSAGGKGYR